jgi:hypothetical protein
VTFLSCTDKVIANALSAIVEEMGEALVRASFSANISIGMCSAWQTVAPCLSNSAVEQSRRSFLDSARLDGEGIYPCTPRSEENALYARALQSSDESTRSTFF